ncbi:MAG: hypothetical protein ACLQGP_22190 [Isosphaeraceae bacterium]
MTQSRRGNDIPRSSRPSAPAEPTRTFLLGRPFIAFLRKLYRTGWSSALGRLAPRWSRQTDPATIQWPARTRRSSSHVFNPTIDGRLEVRMLLSSAGQRFLSDSAYLLKHPSARKAYNLKQPPFLSNNAPHFNNVHGYRVKTAIATQTARGGQAVEVTALDGSHYMVKLSYTSNTIETNTAEGSNGTDGNATSAAAGSLVSEQNANYPQPIGTIRAYAMSGGRVGIIVDGSTQNTDLTINPLGEPQKKGYAQSFAYGESGRNHLLNIGQITVNSGTIGAIEGYQDAELSGPLTVSGSSAIDRIAFAAILPGASITTGGDLETLDVLNQIDLSGSGTGITIGRDLNLLNVGGSITLSNGANFQIDRDLGLVSQPPKGTGTGSNVLSLNYTSVSNSIVTVTIPSVGSFIQGGITINPGSVFAISGNIYNTMYTEGTINGYIRIFINYGLSSQANPPFITSLAVASSIPPTGSGPAPDGYLTAIGGIIP